MQHNIGIILMPFWMFWTFVVNAKASISGLTETLIMMLTLRYVYLLPFGYWLICLLWYSMIWSFFLCVIYVVCCNQVVNILNSHTWLRWYTDIPPRHFPQTSSRTLNSYTVHRCDNCHESNFYWSSTLLSSIPTSI